MRKSIHTEEHRRLAARLAELRRDAGVTQVELAAKLGASQSFVTKYESGDRRLDLIQLRDICRALDVRVSVVVREFD